MIKSIVLLIVTFIFFTGCHRFHPVATAIIAVPVFIASPIFNRPHHHHQKRHYRGHSPRGR